MPRGPDEGLGMEQRQRQQQKHHWEQSVSHSTGCVLPGHPRMLTYCITYPGYHRTNTERHESILDLVLTEVASLSVGYISKTYSWRLRRLDDCPHKKIIHSKHTSHISGQRVLLRFLPDTQGQLLTTVQQKSPYGSQCCVMVRVSG